MLPSVDLTFQPRGCRLLMSGVTIARSLVQLFPGKLSESSLRKGWLKKCKCSGSFCQAPHRETLKSQIMCHFIISRLKKKKKKTAQMCSSQKVRREIWFDAALIRLASLSIGHGEMKEKGGPDLFAGPTQLHPPCQWNGEHSAPIKGFPFSGLLTFWAYLGGLRGFVAFHSLRFVTFSAVACKCDIKCLVRRVWQGEFPL